MRRIMIACLLLIGSVFPASAQDLQSILQTHAAEIAKPSRNSVSVTLDDLVASGLPQVTVFLEQWATKNVWQRDDGLFVFATADGDALAWTSIDDAKAGTASKETYKQMKPNGGVRRLIATALVQFQLSDPDLARRETAVASIARRPDASQLAPLLASIAGEVDPALKARKTKLANFMSARFADDPADRIAAINSLSRDTSVEARAVLNQIVTKQSDVAIELPVGNIKAINDPFDDPDASYLRLVDVGLAAAPKTLGEIRQALEANIIAGRIGGVPIAQLSDPALREVAYAALTADGLVTPLITQNDQTAALNTHVFYTIYTEPNADITAAAEAALSTVEARVATAQMADLTLDALSLASIFFLAAIGLAITFGVMGVINMAHGEFIMMGAYTGYVVQLFIPNYTVSIIVALPLAFAVTFAAGVVMERLVIRWLYDRPLETLLATFGISVALQQL
ncbi:MAG: urea transport system permease protein, partial [Yoonia sp.]